MLVLMKSLISLIQTDCNGSVPLWEAMMGRHESVAKLLIDNGADISLADVGHFACFAVEQNNLELLKDIVKYGGDVTRSKSNGTTALHAAVCEGNIEIVKFLLDQGADIDRQDANGWTPRAFADHQCHTEIQNIFQNTGGHKKNPSDIPPIPKNDGGYFVGRWQSEPSISAIPQGSMPPNQELTWLDNCGRRRASAFHNSFFGIMSATNRGKYGFIFINCWFSFLVKFYLVCVWLIFQWFKERKQQQKKSS